WHNRPGGQPFVMYFAHERLGQRFPIRFGRNARLSPPADERISMKKLNKVASLFASATLAVSASSVFAQADQPKSIDNWVNATGIPWKNGTNELCWRDATWTPATAHPDCDGALKPVAPPPPPPPPPPP